MSTTTSSRSRTKRKQNTHWKQQRRNEEMYTIPICCHWQLGRWRRRYFCLSPVGSLLCVSKELWRHHLTAPLVHGVRRVRHLHMYGYYGANREVKFHVKVLRPWTLTSKSEKNSRKIWRVLRELTVPHVSSWREFLEVSLGYPDRICVSFRNFIDIYRVCWKIWYLCELNPNPARQNFTSRHTCNLTSKNYT